jgi:DNA-binding transcriptional ArsR family regulator
VRATASPDLLAEVERFGVHYGKVWVHLLGLVIESAAPWDVPAFLAHLAETDPLELHLHLMGYYWPAAGQHVASDVILRAARGDAAARKAYLDAVDAYHDDCGDSYGKLLDRDPAETKELLLRILPRWYDEVVRAQEDALLTLERDAEAKRRLARRLPPERLIDVATSGLQYTPEPGIRRVLLLPALITRPWVIISEHRDTKIFCYAATDEILGAEGAPPAAQLVRLYKALADERRLQILRLLATRSLTLQEIADHLGIGKSLAHHHLVTLRAAGLTRTRIGEDKRYDLRPDAVSTVGALLSAYIGAENEESGEERTS